MAEPEAFVQQCIRDACLLEAAARKPGNVHPGAAFVDLNFKDLVQSALAVAPVLVRAGETGVGRAVLEAVSATRKSVEGNSNLGIVLLLAPLCAVPFGTPLGEGIVDVLQRLTRQDARLVYEAIRLARPGGLGTAGDEDVSGEPHATLLITMRLAAERDRIAEQFATGFDLVLCFGVGRLEELWSPAAGRSAADVVADTIDTAPHFQFRAAHSDWETAIVSLHLELMSRCPDTLIARKCGRAAAGESARRARAVLEAGWPGSARGDRELVELDRWLRADGHRRNPGTTADLVAAILFAALRDGHIDVGDKV